MASVQRPRLTDTPIAFILGQLSQGLSTMKTRLTAMLATTLLGALALACPVAQAQDSLSPAQVSARTGAPPELAQWADWVLHGQVGYRCAYRDGSRTSDASSRVCEAVSPLEVASDEQGTRFRFQARMDEAGALPLPSAAGAWPQDMRVDGQPASLVKDAQGKWQVLLEEGVATVGGSWPASPGQIQVPAVFAHARDLRTGRALAVEQGTVWIAGRPVPVEQESEDQVSPTAQVWRLLEDGAAARLTTRLVLTIPRPERLVLGPALPQGFEPVSWTSNAQLSFLADGTIHLQAVRGVVTIDLVARCTQACATQPEEALSPIAPPEAEDAIWPESEVWSFQANPTFRHLTASGSGVDPAAAGVPRSWAHLPAFRLTSNQGLGFRTVSRGPGAVQGEGLTLWRRAWHTPDQWLQLDYLHGRLPAAGRLAMAPPHALESAHSSASPLPLTVLEEGGAPGVQWPTATVEMLVQSRRDNDAPMTMGWNQPMSNMHVLLHLPVGEVLLAAPGNQRRASEWVAHFTLVRFFGIALLGFLVFHLQHHRLLLTPLAVVLAAGWVHHPAAQGILLLVGAVGALLIVASALAPGRARKIMRALATGALALALLVATPFIVSQAHYLLYPDHQPHQRTVASSFGPDRSSPLAGDLMVGVDPYGGIGIQAKMGRPEHARPTAGRAQMTLSVGAMADEVSAPPPAPAPAPPAATLQDDPLSGLGLARAGTALPQWPAQLTNSYHLHYPGPLPASDAAQPSFKLWILPSWGTWLARLLGSLGLLALLAGMVQRLYQEWRPPLDPTSKNGRPGPTKPAVPTQALASLAMTALAVGLLAPAGVAQAQSSPHPGVPASSAGLDSQLEELRRRLTAPPACAPTCATLTHVALEATDDRVRARFGITAQAPTTWALPVVKGGVLESSRMAGRPLWFHGSHARLPTGQVSLEVVYQIQSAPFVLEFAHSPLAVDERLGPGWVSEGLDAQGRLSAPTGASWVLKRAQLDHTPNGDAAPLPESTPPVVLAHLERAFDFSRSVSIGYRLSRLDPVARSMQVSWPKIPGESVDSDRVEDRGDHWRVTLAAHEPSLSWRATLPASTSRLEVRALPATLGKESWLISSSPAWELTVQGVPATQASDRQASMLLLPLPQETLEIQARRLGVLEGPTQRLDKASVSTTAGAKTARHTLELELFTTQAGSYAIGLPPDAQLVSVTRNAAELPLPLDAGRLDVPLERGKQSVVVVFQSPVGTTLVKAPSISLDGRVANLHWEINPGTRRWVLAAGGPGAGPAIFYWPLLLVFLAMAWGVSRLPNSPVSLPTALLLTLGLSMLPHTLIMLASLVGWLWLIRYRARLDVQATPPPRFQLLQVGFVMLTGWCALLVLGNLGWGLIGASPDMMIQGYTGQRNALAWYLGQYAEGATRLPWVFSLPVWVYQAILLAWSLWFTAWLFSAGKRALSAFTQGGHWKGRARLPKDTPDASSRS